MIKSKSSIFSRNSSRVGKAISDNSSTGTASCFPGGRRIVKCTRSTELSDFNKLRHVRVPGCGSPLTRRTRKRSRMALIDKSMLLFCSVNSPSSGARRSSKIFVPPCGRVMLTSTSSLVGKRNLCSLPPSTATLSSTIPV